MYDSSFGDFSSWTACLTCHPYPSPRQRKVSVAVQMFILFFFCPLWTKFSPPRSQTLFLASISIAKLWGVLTLFSHTGITNVESYSPLCERSLVSVSRTDRLLLPSILSYWFLKYGIKARALAKWTLRKQRAEWCLLVLSVISAA